MIVRAVAVCKGNGSPDPASVKYFAFYPVPYPQLLDSMIGQEDHRFRGILDHTAMMMPMVGCKEHTMSMRTFNDFRHR